MPALLRTLLVCLLAGRSACAWGPAGHKIVARIAESRLTSQAAAAVRQILGPGRHLTDIANLADEIRDREPQTEPWHFVNIPLDATSYDPARDCPKGQCIIAAIERFRHELETPGLAPQARFQALHNLVHFVGDLHQPLHCGDNHDRGGNDVAVEFLDQPSNLHRVWDSGIVNWMLHSQPDQWEFLARRLGRISGARQAAWSRGSAAEWAMESHDIAREVVYRFQPPPSGPVVLGRAYVQRSAPVVRGQLAKAGIRLAYVLNRAFEGR